MKQIKNIDKKNEKQNFSTLADHGKALYKPVKNLLSLGNTNAKTTKNEIETFILYLAPADTIVTHNLCPFASNGCKKACLYTAGRGKFSNVQQSRINKTKFWAYDREKFYIKLEAELYQVNQLAKIDGKKVAVRLNGTSDVDHLALLQRYTGRNFNEYQHIQFYDYTKNPNMIKKYLNTNYHLTFSLSESNFFEALNVLESGGNVAAVFANGLPETWLKYTVINGDLSDYRPNDPKNCVVGLTAKGDAKKDLSGFVIRN